MPPHHHPDHDMAGAARTTRKASSSHATLARGRRVRIAHGSARKCYILDDYIMILWDYTYGRLWHYCTIALLSHSAFC